MLRARLTAAIAAALVVVTGGSGAAIAHRAAHTPEAATPFVPVSAAEFVPATPLTQVLRQPDGATFHATLTPATQGGLFEVAPGYSLARDRTHTWRYVAGRDRSGRLLFARTPVGVTGAPA